MPTTQIAPGLNAIAAGPANTFLLDDPDGCTLIDTGVPGKADAILQAIRTLGKQPRDIKHILLTHAHADHIGSAHALKQATGAQTYMHALDAPIAQSGKGYSSNVALARPGEQSAVSRFCPHQQFRRTRCH